ncbi:MAG TPA: hypothetical protein VKQ30_08235, partial [Ktedonobacterales bacterium]|nr:hypothetical protein [Ktedonobacterales bacterium]
PLPIDLVEPLAELLRRGAGMPSSYADKPATPPPAPAASATPVPPPVSIAPVSTPLMPPGAE